VDLFLDETANMYDEAANDAELYYNDFFDPPSIMKPFKAFSHRVGQPTQKSQFSKVRFHEEVKVKSIKAKGKGNPVTSIYDDPDLDDDGEDVDEVNYPFFGGEDSLEDLTALDGFSNDFSENEDEEGDNGDDELVDEPGDRLAIERLRDDLFAEEEKWGKSEDGLTSHEQRIRAIQVQIQELEAENVAKKHWTLMGEASSKARPHASLLEEDLEFERAAKSAPLVTEELVRSLEDTIKKRIADSRYDDVVRRRPVDNKPFLPSRFFELQDTKSAQSLAQIYEDEYVRAQNGLGDDRDGRLKADHDEIQQLWDGICNKLDALCNAHYVPKQVRSLSFCFFPTLIVLLLPIAEGIHHHGL